MSNQNNAAVALPDEELRTSSPFQWLARRYTPEVAERMLREFEGIVLSKLRAPAAGEVAPPDWADRFPEISDMNRLNEAWRAASMRVPVAEVQIGVDVTEQGATVCLVQPHADGSATVIYSETHPIGGSVGRAALASAPVAGEAQLPWHLPVQHWTDEEKAKLLAAPQASEAVRDQAFETVRKQLCKLPRYSFLIGPHGGVKRFSDRSGNWIEFDAAHALFDPVSVDSALSAQPGAQMKGGSDGDH